MPPPPLPPLPPLLPASPPSLLHHWTCGLLTVGFSGSRRNRFDVKGKENEVVEEVMKQYFEGGKHPGDKLMLAEAAAAAGLDQEAAAAFLETDEGAIEVHQSKKDCSTALHFGLMPDKTSTKPDPQK